MNKKIVFYNSHQYGDLLHCRQSARWIVNNLDDSFSFYFIHNKNPESIFFHDKIAVCNFDFDFHAVPMNQMKKFCSNFELLKDAFWVDLWVGSFEGAKSFILPDGSYKCLLPDERGLCTSFSEHINDTLNIQKRLIDFRIDELNSEFAINFFPYKIPYPEEKDLICEWNNNPKNKVLVDKLLENNSCFEKSILICNGETTSGQRTNFSYEQILEDIIKNNPNVCFYLTDKMYFKDYSNLFYINDYFPLPNLKEIEYLMKFCDIIVSSQSGPGCSAFVDAIVNDVNKKLIIICSEDIKTFNTNTKCQLVELFDFRPSKIIEVINNALDY